MTMKRGWGFFLVTTTLGVCLLRCASSAPSQAESGKRVPLRQFASTVEAEAAMLELEDRRAFDSVTLESAARSPEAPLRARAALALGRIGEERGRALLQSLLADPSAQVRSAAAFGSQLLSDPALTSDLIPLLADSDIRVAASAAKAIGFLARGDGQDALVAAIPKAASPEPRATMLRELWRFSNAATEEVALAYVNDADRRVRSAAIYALARKPRESSIAALTAALSDPDSDTAALAARALGILGQKESIEPLASVLESRKPPLLTNALVSLETILEKNPGASVAKEQERRILELASDTNPNLAIPALVLLRQFAAADREVFRWLWSVGATGKGRRRQVALQSVAAVPRVKVAGLLEAAIQSEEPALRSAAAESLGYLPWKEVEPLRSQLASDRQVAVRLAVLSSLRAPEAVRESRALVDAALSDPDAGVRAAAIEALAVLNDPEILRVLSDAIVKSYTDANPDVPIAAIAAAEKLRGDPAARSVVEAAYRHPRALIKRLARRSLIQSFRAEPTAYPMPEYPPARTPADYMTLLSEARKPWEATVETSRGTFRIRLAGAEAPLTVMNFVRLARRGYFDGTVFHRVVPNFVIQGGDPTATGNGGPGYEIRDELNPLEYIEGTVGMALSGPDTGGSQWFVTHAAQPHLDGIYTVFGQVVLGQDVVERIEQGDQILRITLSQS